MDEAEDRRVRAAANCQRQHGRGRERFVPDEKPYAKPDVRNQRITPTGATYIVPLLSDLDRRAEAAQRIDSRIVGRHAGSNVFFSTLVDMKLELFGDFVMDTRRSPQRGAPAKPALHDARMTFPMASARCVQSAASAASCFLPARVNV